VYQQQLTSSLEPTPSPQHKNEAGKFEDNCTMHFKPNSSKTFFSFKYWSVNWIFLVWVVF